MNCWKICGLDAGGRWCCGAGVGKSALLEYALSTATDMRVARAAGAESEMELAFASLHLLCVPLLDRVENLPGPQRDALAVAFGLREGAVPDRFMVALAGLTLLAEPVGLIFAMREPSEQFRGLADLEVRGLPAEGTRTLLRRVVRFRLDETVWDRILAETNGNPLALLELPRGLDPAQLAGGLGLVGAQPVPARIEQGFRRRLDALPADARSLMLVAAAEPVGDMALV